MSQKTKLNKTIPLTGTIEFKLWNQNGYYLFFTNPAIIYFFKLAILLLFISFNR